MFDMEQTKRGKVQESKRHSVTLQGKILVPVRYCHVSYHSSTYMYHSNTMYMYSILMDGLWSPGDDLLARLTQASWSARDGAVSCEK